jgi:hypothetical protein
LHRLVICSLESGYGRRAPPQWVVAGNTPVTLSWWRCFLSVPHSLLVLLRVVRSPREPLHRRLRRSPAASPPSQPCWHAPAYVALTEPRGPLVSLFD